MRKSIAVLFLLTVPAAQLKATVVLPIGLAPGSQYELIFTTSDGTPATSSNIADYNAFVSNEAALGAPFGLPSGLTWAAVGSTTTIDAFDNAPSVNTPVYNTQGQLVAASSIYTGSLLTPVLYDQHGVIPTYNLTWTGSVSSGQADGGFELGASSMVETGFRLETNGRWLDDSPVENHSTSRIILAMYALSSPISVPTPEPATITLLGSALLLLGGHRFLRWRRG